MAKEYVAYGNLGSYKPGDTVNPTDWDAEQWAYMVDHEMVVPKNSPNDPNVLEENARTQAQQAAAEQTAAESGGSILAGDAGPQSVKVQEGMKAHEEAGKAAPAEDAGKASGDTGQKPTPQVGAKSGTETKPSSPATPPKASEKKEG